jgi:hypothetical protein
LVVNGLIIGFNVKRLIMADLLNAQWLEMMEKMQTEKVQGGEENIPNIGNRTHDPLLCNMMP